MSFIFFFNNVLYLIYQVANIIFVDSPVGTGFSYATSWTGLKNTDTSQSALLYEFLRKVRGKLPGPIIRHFRWSPRCLPSVSFCSSYTCSQSIDINHPPQRIISDHSISSHVSINARKLGLAGGFIRGGRARPLKFYGVK